MFGVFSPTIKLWSGKLHSSITELFAIGTKVKIAVVKLKHLEGGGKVRSL